MVLLNPALYANILELLQSVCYASYLDIDYPKAVIELL